MSQPVREKVGTANAKEGNSNEAPIGKADRFLATCHLRVTQVVTGISKHSTVFNDFY